MYGLARRHQTASRNIKTKGICHEIHLISTSWCFLNLSRFLISVSDSSSSPPANKWWYPVIDMFPTLIDNIIMMPLADCRPPDTSHIKSHHMLLCIYFKWKLELFSTLLSLTRNVCIKYPKISLFTCCSHQALSNLESLSTSCSSISQLVLFESQTRVSLTITHLNLQTSMSDMSEIVFKAKPICKNSNTNTCTIEWRCSE